MTVTQTNFYWVIGESMEDDGREWVGPELIAAHNKAMAEAVFRLHNQNCLNVLEPSFIGRGYDAIMSNAVKQMNPEQHPDPVEAITPEAAERIAAKALAAKA